MAIRWSGLVHSRRHRWTGAVCLLVCLAVTVSLSWQVSTSPIVPPEPSGTLLEHPTEVIEPVGPLVSHRLLVLIQARPSQSPAVIEAPEAHSQIAFLRNESLNNQLYRQVPLQIPGLHQVHYLPDRLADVPLLPQPCLGEWLRHGRLDDASCHDNPADTIDVVWTWLNGSDPEWAQHNVRWSAFTEIGRDQRPPARHYRDHGELRHSLRSIRKFMPQEAVGKLVLVGGDWEAPFEDSMRVGQRPEWLKDDSSASPRVKITSHSEMWSGFIVASGKAVSDVVEERGKLLATQLPTFNRYGL